MTVELLAAVVADMVVGEVVAVLGAGLVVGHRRRLTSFDRRLVFTMLLSLLSCLVLGVVVSGTDTAFASLLLVLAGIVCIGTCRALPHMWLAHCLLLLGIVGVSADAMAALDATGVRCWW